MLTLPTNVDSAVNFNAINSISIDELNYSIKTIGGWVAERLRRWSQEQNLLEKSTGAILACSNHVPSIFFMAVKKTRHGT